MNYEREWREGARAKARQDGQGRNANQYPEMSGGY
jgi:hypothetical protein